MTNQPDDIRQWIQELISRSAADQMQNLKRFEEMLHRSLRGEIDQTRLREEYMHFAQQESARYISDLTRVGLSFYNTLLELNRHYNDRFFEQVTREKRHPGMAVKSEPRQIDMELNGPLGGDAVRSFVIENQRNEPVAVSFLVSEFVSPDEETSFRPPLQLSPARFTLPPGEERLISMRIPLLKEFFTPGLVYTATVLVSGFEAMQLYLKVRADPPQAPTVEAGQPARRQPVYYPVDDSPVPDAARSDNLKLIKGVGPAIERKLQSGGVKTFTHLAECDQTDLERLLGASMAQRSIRERWQEQARLAAAGDWNAIAFLQGRLSQADSESSSNGRS